MFGWLLFDYLDMIRVLFFWYEFDMNLMVKNMTSIELYCLRIWYSWKVLILLVFLVIDEMQIDVLLMCYFFIKYGIFCVVRENALFSRVWGDFWWDSGDFWWCEKWWKWRKMGILSNSLPNSKMAIDVWIEEICRSWLPAACSKM